MSETKKVQPPEFRTNGTLAKKGVVVAEQSSIDALTSTGIRHVRGQGFHAYIF